MTESKSSLKYVLLFFFCLAVSHNVGFLFFLQFQKKQEKDG